MGDLQDPKMEVLDHHKAVILWGYSLKLRPATIGQTYMVGTSNESVPVAWPLINVGVWNVFGDVFTSQKG